MKVLVCGSREWDNPHIIWDALSALREFYPDDDIELIHGDARGADKIAGNAAKALGMSVTPVPAEWEKFGKVAGPMRNKEMLGMNPDTVLAFRCDGKSPGTDHMVKLAVRSKIPVRIIDKRGLYHDTGGTL
jgi:hypothetical protein